MTGSEQKRGIIRGVFVASLFLATGTVGCGSKIDGGNTGSETHWLKSCDRDSECGEYSCLCGVCSRECDQQAECEESASVDSYCTATSSVSACGDNTPARICLERDDNASSSPDAGEAVSTADAGEQTTEPEQTTDAGEQTTEPARLTICDGSDDVRWVYQAGLGYVEGEDAFTGVYGDQFLVIDGHCNFWGSWERGHVLTGTITELAVVEAFQDAEYGRLNRFADILSTWGCPDAGSTLVSDPSGTIYGSQCGIPDELVELQASFAAASSFASEVLTLGTRTQGSLRLLIVQASESGEVPWPLDLDPTEWIPNVALGWEELSEPLAGIKFEAGNRAELLRAAEGNNGTFFEYVGAEQTSYFRALLRDELPPKIAATLQACVSDASAKQLGSLGDECPTSTECSYGLLCQERTADQGGGTACNTCVEPNDPDWLCRSNDDCCAGTVCCLDCGERSGTCIVDADPCETCIANGGSWVMPDTCDSECPADAQCSSTSCPGPCDETNCDGCGRRAECWAAGCSWVVQDESHYCSAPIIDSPPAEPCYVDATAPDLPGVSVHLETDNCTFVVGAGGEFRYVVTLNQSFDFTTESSGGGCGLCGGAADPETWTQFLIAGNNFSYCPECSTGCCAPTEAVATNVDAQSIEGTIDWPGLEWNGPSDTLAQPEGEFPAGSYSATLTFALPGVGEVVARLPITVAASTVTP